MDPKQYLFVDERFLGQCVFCGGPPKSRDHVPSKAFLREPWPAQLPIVEACIECNNGSSLDEEYLACFLEVVLAGTADPEQLSRENVKRALLRNAKLRSLIESSLEISESGTKTWHPDLSRVQKVVVKLAQGHAAYELSLPQLDEPASIGISPLSAMNDEIRIQFENAGTGEMRGWPEVGSRAMLRAAGADPYANSPGPWIEVQPSVYRYSVDQFGGVHVRMVFAEYLACEVIWESSE